MLKFKSDLGLMIKMCKMFDNGLEKLVKQNVLQKY